MGLQDAASVINAVLDIDRVFVCKNAKSLNTAQFFKNKGVILTAVKTNYIVPGGIEFVRLLNDTENVKPSFYSSGAEARNIPLVQQISELSSAKKTISVLSRGDLARNCDENSDDHYRKYGLKVGGNQKDISKVLSTNERIENAILIDDDETYVACGQAKNWLYVPPTDGDHFEALSSKLKYYQPSGYRVLKCLIRRWAKRKWS